ncbi:MAG: hypothetical protein OXF02_07245 [Simkaniaceae bacterium]|nr:hypothetical protein [Simkaniaceae bacterium]
MKNKIPSHKEKRKSMRGPARPGYGPSMSPARAKGAMRGMKDMNPGMPRMKR